MDQGQRVDDVMVAFQTVTMEESVEAAHERLVLANLDYAVVVMPTGQPIGLHGRDQLKSLAGAGQTMAQMLDVAPSMNVDSGLTLDSVAAALSEAFFDEPDAIGIVVRAAGQPVGVVPRLTLARYINTREGSQGGSRGSPGGLPGRSIMRPKFLRCPRGCRELVSFYDPADQQLCQRHNLPLS